MRRNLIFQRVREQLLYDLRFGCCLKFKLVRISTHKAKTFVEALMLLIGLRAKKRDKQTYESEIVNY